MKVCFYAINGHGLGHLSRCHAIAKRLDELLAMVSVQADIQILTTSEADYIVRDFPVVKIPSRSCFKGRKGAATRYMANGKMMVSSMLSHFSPDLLVMDTVATGSFNEFNFVRGFAKKSVLVERHKTESYANSNLHQSHLNLFDCIIVPDEEGRLADYYFPEAVKDRVRAVGMVHNLDSSQTLTKFQVRAEFNVPQDYQLVYLSAGGGGDKTAEETLLKLLDVLAEKKVVVVVGYGPLSTVAKPYGRENVIVYTEAEIRRYFKGFDLAISAAGYNSYEELLAAGTPTLFYAQAKGMDMQQRRVDQGVEAGWHGELDFEQDISLQIDGVLTQGRSAELEQRIFTLGAYEAAYQMALLQPGLNELMALDLELASYVAKLAGRGDWVTENLVGAYTFYKDCIRPVEPSERMKQQMKALVSFESGGVDKDLMDKLDLSERLFGVIKNKAVDEGEMKRMMRLIKRAYQQGETINLELIESLFEKNEQQ